MSDQKYTVVAIDALDRIGALVPVRTALDLQSFGLNAWVAKEAGERLVPEHEEDDTGHEEVYLVMRGRATFTLAGETIDAPAGTIVFPHDPAIVRSAVAAEPDTTVLAMGATPGKIYKPTRWEENRRAIDLLEQQRYDEAVQVLSDALEAEPDNTSFLYNRGCVKALLGDADGALLDLTAACEAEPRTRGYLTSDPDLDSLREDPRFQRLLAGE